MKKNLLLTLALCLILLMTFCTAASAEDTYTLTVNGGTGSGTYAEDARVIVIADDPPAGQVFVRWDTPYNYLYNVDFYQKELSFRMPDANFRLTAVFADPHTHAPCGNATCTDATHPAHTAHNYLPLEDINDLRLNAGDNYYHLSQDITLTYNVSAPSYISIGSGKTLYLCLHGYDIISASTLDPIFQLSGTGKLVICDCKGADISTWGKIMHSTGSKSSDVGIKMNGSIDTADDPVLEMYGGNITGNNPNSSDSFRNNGAGVYADYGSTIAMYNGAITNNKTNQLGGGVCLFNGGTFTMYDGIISGNTAYKGGGIYSDSVKTTVNAVAIHGGTITGNIASYGAGLYIERDESSDTTQDLLITGGTITENKGTQFGGGVYLDYSQATMSAGTISGNELTYDYEDYGGGVYLYTSSRFNMNGGTIKENKADYGAGVYVVSSCNGFFVSGSATVTDNKTSNVYLDSRENQDKCIQITGPLTGTIGVKTKHTPSATKPVRFLHPSNYTLTKSDLDHIVSDVSGTYYVKNIDQENYGIFGYVQYKVAVSTVENGKVTASSSSAAEGKSIGLTIEPDTGYELDTVKVYDADGEAVEVSADYKFTMPASDVTVEATFQPMQYTIQFMNMDGTVLQSTEVAYGEMPVYTGETPTVAADAQYTYTFTGWSPDVVKVTGAATYTATYSNSINTYTVTWVDEDGTTVLETDEDVPYGTMPSYDGKTPTKAADAQYTYTFSGWSPSVVNVSGNATYTATFSNSTNTYTVTWVDEDGTTVLEKDEGVPYGTMPSYDGAKPTKTATAQYTYTFDKWSPEISAVSGTVTYKATYTATTNKYTIQFVNEDGTVLQTGDVPYGETPVYTGETPTKAADAQYTYTFSGWSPSVVNVSGNATYTATYSDSTNSYTVTWQNEAGELIDAESVVYGGSVTKSPAVPDKLGHTGKWNHDGKNIVQNTIIKPEYTANQYTLTFNTDGGSVIAPITQKYGSAVTAPAAPVKEGWIFQGWDKVLPATMPAENMAFTAKWVPRTTLASFSLSATEIWLHSTQTHQLEVTGLDPSGALCEFTWTSSDTSVLSVDSTGLLTASAPGTAVLTVKEKWSGLSKTCTVHVASPVTAITFAETVLQMAPGDTRTLTATVTCSDQTVTNKLVTFSSSDEKVATVDQNGIVTAVSEGNVTITATAANGVSASCTIKILLLGDANGDGKVDVADVLIILQYSAGWDVTVNTAKADVTGDGTIGLSDALKILQDCMGGDIALAMRTLQRMLADLNASTLEITEQPADQHVKAGETAAFTVTATGDALKYQWYINRNDGNGWQKLNNAVEATYVTSTVDADNDGYQYRCVITDAHGNEATTDTAELHVVLDLPNTGDASTPALWLAMCMLSAIGLMILKKKLAIR